jgi:hypothetical protein
MAKALKELALFAAGLALGGSLFYLSSLVGYDPDHCGGCVAWGLPFFWRISATGPGGPESPNEPQFALDIVFWLALGLTLVEVSSRVVVPHVRRKRVR